MVSTPRIFKWGARVSKDSQVVNGTESFYSGIAGTKSRAAALPESLLCNLTSLLHSSWKSDTSDTAQGLWF